jgi:hypothetical protein
MNSDCAVCNDMPSNRSSATQRDSVFTPQKMTKRTAGLVSFMAAMLARSVIALRAGPRYEGREQGLLLTMRFPRTSNLAPRIS